MTLNNKNNGINIDFIGIGVPRAATTWIHKLLEDHPQICVPKEKSLELFVKWRDWQRLPVAYKRFFSHCSSNQTRGHIETGYLYRQEAAILIKKFFPEIKLIVCLRNPIDRAYSHYLLDRSRGKFSPRLTFEDIVFKNYTHQSHQYPQYPQYLEMGLYYQPLRKYLEIFNKKQLLILFYEDIQRDPLKFIQGIYKFLGVSEDFVPRYLYQKINPNVQIRVRVPFVTSYSLSICTKILRQYYLGRVVLNCAKRLRLHRLVNYLIVRNVKDDLSLDVAPDSQKFSLRHNTRRRLQEFYRDDISKLANMIHRDLSFWQ